MNPQKRGIIIGAAIVLLGVLALLQNLDIFPHFKDLAGSLFLILLSLLFLGIYSRNRAQWWPLIPAASLAVLGIGALLNIVFDFSDDFIGAGLFFALAAVFIFIYFRSNSDWWAIIPAGACTSIAMVVIVESLNLTHGSLGGVVFFLGLGLTFLYMWLVRDEQNQLGWAIYPAIILLFLSMLVFTEEVVHTGINILFPLLLIVIGVLVIVRGRRKSSKTKHV